MLIGVVLAVLRRDRTTLLVVAAAATWLLIEIAFAYHGWSAVSRYMIEPAAVHGRRRRRRHRLAAGRHPHPGVLRWLGPVVALALIVALAPDASSRVRTVRVPHRRRPATPPSRSTGSTG